MDRAALDDLYTRADAALETGHARRAVRLLMRGAQAGDPVCADWLGLCYSDGEGTRRDVREALRWLHFARRRGSGISAHNIAVVYAENGRWRLAARWWEWAHAHGDDSAAIDLAMCLLEGRGARRDAARAYSLVSHVVRTNAAVGISPFEREHAMALPLGRGPPAWGSCAPVGSGRSATSDGRAFGSSAPTRTTTTRKRAERSGRWAPQRRSTWRVRRLGRRGPHGGVA